MQFIAYNKSLFSDRLGIDVTSIQTSAILDYKSITTSVNLGMLS